MKNLICLISGLVITILFIVFSDQIYELCYYSAQFSDWMYNENMYLVVAIVTVLVSWGLAAIYYYVINSVRFDCWYHWLIMLFVAMLLAPSVTFIYPNGESAGEGLDYVDPLVNFSIINLIFTVLLFIIASFSIRWWSTNCKHTPIPQ
jgi:hypothetical protein